MKIKKNLKFATALKYDIQKDNAPIIIAKGQGVVAEKIINKAKENDIAIYEDEILAQKLKVLEMGQEIPSQLYEAVAEILLFISKVDIERG